MLENYRQASARRLLHPASSPRCETLETSGSQQFYRLVRPCYGTSCEHELLKRRRLLRLRGRLTANIDLLRKKSKLTDVVL
jgi:hypothetical protein